MRIQDRISNRILNRDIIQKAFWRMLLLTAVLGSLVVIFAGPFSEILGAHQNAEVSLYYSTKAYLRGLGYGLPFTTGTMMLIPIIALNGDKKRIASAASCMMIVNITGDLLNVFWIHREMFGMAFATSFSYICSFAILMVHFRKHMGIHFTREDLKPSLLAAVFKAGLLPSFTRACSFIKSYLINIIYLSYAGVLALAANSLV